MYYCPHCGNAFEIDLVQSLKPVNPNIDAAYANIETPRRCPIKGCFGAIFEIDELIIPIVRFMTYNGYRTIFSCSGHAVPEDHSVAGYLMLEGHLFEGEKLPYGFSIEYEDGGETTDGDWWNPSEYCLSDGFIEKVERITVIRFPRHEMSEFANILEKQIVINQDINNLMEFLLLWVSKNNTMSDLVTNKLYCIE